MTLVPRPVPAGATKPARVGQRAVAVWLLGCALVVVAVLVVGGITRLEHAGLSIVQWQPLVGIVPPLDADDWNAAFALYRTTPEFQLVNSDMTLDGFKRIFWWEYGHRVLGRTAGIAFALPLLWFVAHRQLARTLTLRLGAIFALGALQGALGWYMVASGLVEDPHVSPLRLAAHLGLALLLIAALLWSAWEQWYDPTCRSPLPLPAAFCIGAVFAMALSGGLVAGARAGFVYNSFPLMDGAWVPPGLLRLQPWYDNLRDNLATIQFLHRALALLVVLAVLVCWHRAREGGPGPRRAANRLLLALALQAGLGVATLLSGVALPLAAAHQAGAVLLFACALWTGFALCRMESTGAASPRPRRS